MNILLANFTKMVQDSGGLAKVTVAFANEMTKRGHKVSIVYSDDREGNFFYPVEDRVCCYDLRHLKEPYVQSDVQVPYFYKIKREVLRAFSKRQARTVNNDFLKAYVLSYLKQVVAHIQPDIIISFQPAASKALLCDMETEIPVITMSHGDPEDYFHIYPREEIPAIEKSAMNQVLLPSFEEHIRRHLPKAKTVTIGNAIPQFDSPVDLQVKKEEYKIIFVGRLTRNHKRPHLLIEAFSKIEKSFPHWKVELWGSKDKNSYYKKLEQLIKKKGLENKVFLRGSTTEVPTILSKADIFAFPSAYEGFGMALAEGMSMGLPAVGYRSCSAVNELIEDGKTGYLCEDGIEDFASKLRILMENQELRAQMGKKAHEAMKAYAPEKIWNQWEELLQQVGEKRL